MYLSRSPAMCREASGPGSSFKITWGNQFSPTSIVVPLTTKMKRLEMPTHVAFVWENLEQSMVECEQVRVIDITEDWKYVCTLPPQIMSHIDTALRNAFFYGRGVTDGE